MPSQKSVLSIFSKIFMYLWTYLFQLHYYPTPHLKNKFKAVETPPFRQLIVKSILLSTYFIFNSVDRGECSKGSRGRGSKGYPIKKMMLGERIFLWKLLGGKKKV